MVKAMILDVDGVIVGESKGVNAPDPHPDVMAKLKSVKMPISLCTAKPAFAIGDITKQASLDNPHIADGGGLLVGHDNEIYKKRMLDTDVAGRIVGALLENNIYAEVYTPTNYFIQSDQMCDMAEKHAFVLQRMPGLVDSLEKFSMREEVTKIVAITATEEKAIAAREIFKPIEGFAAISWTIHPTMIPMQFAVFTAPGITKRQGALDISGLLNIPLDNILGVGDSASDWQFIELCGYGAAMGNASEALKELVRSKGPERSYVGKSVDENGIIDIIDWGMSR